MMSIRKAFSLAVIGGASLLGAGCASSSQGYDSIETLYEESVVAMKSGDKAQMERFVRKILPDEHTAKYMEKHGCVYRGFPRKLKDYPDAIDRSRASAAEAYAEFARQLTKDYGSLEKLRFAGFRRPLAPEPMNESGCRCGEILFEEVWGKLVFEGRRDTIPYKVGELLKVDGKWKAFTLRLAM